MDLKQNKTSRKKDLVAHVSNQELIGFGEDVVKVIDALTGDNVCFIGIIDGEEKVYFNKPATICDLEAVAALLNKQKFHRLLAKGKIDKAQSYAERKLKS